MLFGERQRHVAAVAVPEHDSGPPAEEGGEICDVRLDRERSAGAVRPGIAPPVVAQDPIVLIEPPRQPQHRRRAVQRAVDEGDERRVLRTDLV